MSLHYERVGLFEENWDRAVRAALAPNGIAIRSKTVGRLGNASNAVWVVGVRLANGTIATKDVILPPNVDHYSDAAIYLVMGHILASYEPKG